MCYTGFNEYTTIYHTPHFVCVFRTNLNGLQESRKTTRDVQKSYKPNNKPKRSASMGGRESSYVQHRPSAGGDHMRSVKPHQARYVTLTLLLLLLLLLWKLNDSNSCFNKVFKEYKNSFPYKQCPADVHTVFNGLIEYAPGSYVGRHW